MFANYDFKVNNDLVLGHFLTDDGVGSEKKESSQEKSYTISLIINISYFRESLHLFQHTEIPIT